jgi:hypothetical protein
MSNPTINNEFWSSSFEQAGAGDANILDTLHNHNHNHNHNHQPILNGEDGDTIDDSMLNIDLDYEPVEYSKSNIHS